MNKKIIGIIVLIAVFLGFFIFQKTNQNQNLKNPEQLQDKQTASETKTETKSLKELMSLSKNMLCSTTAMEENNEIKNTTYISNGKMRAENQTTVAGKNIVSYFLTDGKDMYAWQQGETKGMKIGLVEMEKMQSDPKYNSQSMQKTQGSLDIENKMAFKCEAWDAEENMFQPPANVTFEDYTSLINKVMPQNQPEQPETAPKSQDMCAACEQAPESARAQCKAALGCK